jgi:hypothetical protein
MFPAAEEAVVPSPACSNGVVKRKEIAIAGIAIRSCGRMRIVG